MKWRLDKITGTSDAAHYHAPRAEFRRAAEAAIRGRAALPHLFCNRRRIFTVARFRPDFPKYAWVSATKRTPIASICLSSRQRPILLLHVLNRAAIPRAALARWNIRDSDSRLAHPQVSQRTPRIRPQSEKIYEGLFSTIICQSKSRYKISWEISWWTIKNSILAF